MVPDVESSIDDSPLPEVSAFASWIDNFKLPIREIENRHTRSELAMLSWYSKLQSYNLSKNRPARDHLALPEGSRTNTVDGYNPNGVTETETSYILSHGLNNGVAIPKKFFDKKGEFDLRQATGPEVATYIRRLGVNVMVPHAI